MNSTITLLAHRTLTYLIWLFSIDSPNVQKSGGQHHHPMKAYIKIFHICNLIAYCIPPFKSEASSLILTTRVDLCVFVYFPLIIQSVLFIHANSWSMQTSTWARSLPHQSSMHSFLLLGCSVDDPRNFLH